MTSSRISELITWFPFVEAHERLLEGINPDI